MLATLKDKCTHIHALPRWTGLQVLRMVRGRCNLCLWKQEKRAKSAFFALPHILLCLRWTGVGLLQFTSLVNLQTQYLPYLPPVSILKHSTICTRRVFLCFAWFSEDYLPLQHYYLAGFHKRGVCSLRGTDWIFKHFTG